MQIKEAAARAALTERAVRLYEERGLIAPDITNKNGRDFRDYSEATVARLKVISALRRALYTIDEIKEMLDDPGRIPEVTEANRSRMRADREQLSFLLSRLEAVDVSSVRNAGELSRALFAQDEAVAADDDGGREEYAERYRRIYDKYFAENAEWEMRYEASLGVGGAMSFVRRFFARRAVRVCLIVLAAAIILAAVLPNVAGIENVSAQFEGEIYGVAVGERGDFVLGEHVGGASGLLLRGKIKRYLFRDTTISGTLDSNTVKNAADRGDAHTFTFGGNFQPYEGGEPELYCTGLFLCETEAGGVRVSEMYVTNALDCAVILMYNTQNEPFKESEEEEYVRGGSVNSLYYRVDEKALAVVFVKDGAASDVLLHRAFNVAFDIYGSKYQQGFGIR